MSENNLVTYLSELDPERREALFSYFMHDAKSRCLTNLIGGSDLISLKLDKESHLNEKRYFTVIKNLTTRLIERIEELKELDQETFVTRVSTLGRTVGRLVQMDSYNTLQLPEELKKQAEDIRDAKDTLNGLINQWFGWNGHGSFNFRSGINTIYGSFRKVLEERDIKLDFNGIVVGSDKWKDYDDKVLVTRSFYISELDNLVGNAIKHAEPENIEVKIEENPGDGSYRVMVRNDGRGIDAEEVYQVALELGAVDPSLELSCEEKRELIFAKAVTTTLDRASYDDDQLNIGGNGGRGMSMIRENIEAKGGRLWFESELGKGTTFYFTIPKEEVVE